MFETAGATQTSSLAGDYVIDSAHSRIGFSARHAMVTKVRGSFGEFSGTAHIDDDPSASYTSVTISAASFTTGQEQRDGHVKSADFLDVENSPELTFRSTSVESVGDNLWRITGDLTIRGTARSITIDFESTGLAKDPSGNIRAGFAGATTINRKDYGVAFNAALETGGVLVSEEVGLEFDISAIKTA